MDTRKYIRPFLQRNVARFLPPYIHNRNLVNKGNGEFTFLRHPIQGVLLAKIAYDWLPLWTCITLVIAYLTACWMFGWFWDKNKGYDTEIEWSNERNPTLQTIKSKVDTKPTLTKRKA